MLDVPGGSSLALQPTEMFEPQHESAFRCSREDLCCEDQHEIRARLNLGTDFCLTITYGSAWQRKTIERVSGPATLTRTTRHIYKEKYRHSAGLRRRWRRRRRRRYRGADRGRSTTVMMHTYDQKFVGIEAENANFEIREPQQVVDDIPCRLVGVWRIKAGDEQGLFVMVSILKLHLIENECR